MLRPPLIAEDRSQRQQHQRQQIKDGEDTQNAPCIKSLEKMAVVTRVVEHTSNQKTRQRKKQIERAPTLQPHDRHVMQQRPRCCPAPVVERKHHRHRQRTESVKGREPHAGSGLVQTLRRAGGIAPVHCRKKRCSRSLRLSVCESASLHDAIYTIKE